MKKNKNIPNVYIDTADICELAHTFTERECKKRKIKLDKVSKDGDYSYTAPAQKVFDYYYDNITNILNI